MATSDAESDSFLEAAIEPWYVRLVSPFYDDETEVRCRCVAWHLARLHTQHDDARPLYGYPEESAIYEVVADNIADVLAEACDER